MPQSPQMQSLGHGETLHSPVCCVGTAGSQGTPPFTWQVWRFLIWDRYLGTNGNQRSSRRNQTPQIFPVILLVFVSGKPMLVEKIPPLGRPCGYGCGSPNHNSPSTRTNPGDGSHFVFFFFSMPSDRKSL